MTAGTPDGSGSLRAVVHGRVQGVGFRWSTDRELARLDLRGSAENRSDGTVVVTASGPAAALDVLVAWLRGVGPSGPPGSVERVDVER
ncbi:acylphosphatase [Luteimicrobium sp. DT211]|uniref:acylphosphatase n=1 Tax=Luteimicrobium sp. DT211 TaxID=3393412 RepID=UPI003CF507B9